MAGHDLGEHAHMVDAWLCVKSEDLEAKTMGGMNAISIHIKF